MIQEIRSQKALRRRLHNKTGYMLPLTYTADKHTACLILQATEQRLSSHGVNTGAFIKDIYIYTENPKRQAKNSVLIDFNQRSNSKNDMGCTTIYITVDETVVAESLYPFILGELPLAMGFTYFNFTGE